MGHMTSPNGRTGLLIYLGPQLPRWFPRSIDDVEVVIADGSLRERHWLDVKAELGTSEGAKKDFARDLASFANDGGALLVGVRENKPAQTFVVDEVPLEGLSERVDEIARYRCDPPLYVACHPIVGTASAGEPASGVLLVEVPPSPSAPHMVDGRYYGRGDTTNRRLTNGEVARLHAVRTSRQASAEQLIDAEVRRDPIPIEHRQLSHLFVVAHPLASPPDLLTSLLGTQELSHLVAGAASVVPGAGGAATPNWAYLQQFNEPRADGMGFRSYGMLGRRFLPDLPDSREDQQLDVEICDDGRVTLFCGGASRIKDTEQYVADALTVVLTRCAVTLAGRLGARGGYAGRWLIVAGIEDLQGKYSSSKVNIIGPGYYPFSADRYVQGTEGVTRGLLDQPGQVTRHLLGRLLRALGTDGSSEREALLVDPPTA